MKVLISELEKIQDFGCDFAIQTPLTEQETKSVTKGRQMIARRTQLKLEEEMEMEILKAVARRLNRTYHWLHLADDCESELALSLIGIRDSIGYICSDRPELYLRSALFRVGNHFYQKDFRRSEAISVDKTCNGADGFLQDDSRLNQELGIDISNYLATLPERSRAVFQFFMNGMNDREIGDQLGMSQQAVHKLKEKLFSKAQKHFKGHKHDCN